MVAGCHGCYNLEGRWALGRVACAYFMWKGQLGKTGDHVRAGYLKWSLDWKALCRTFNFELLSHIT